MVKKDATTRFFAGLASIGSGITGTDSPLAVAARTAVDQPSPSAIVNAQEELAKLPEDLRVKILSEVHALMRNDIEAIWDKLSNAPDTDRPN